MTRGTTPEVTRPVVDRRRVEDAIERAAERAPRGSATQHAVVADGLVVAAVVERAVARRGLVQQRRASLRAHVAGRRIAEERRVEAMRAPSCHVPFAA